MQASTHIGDMKIKHSKWSVARQLARTTAARCWREWRKDRTNRHWRAEYRSALQWDKKMEVGL